MKENLKRKIQEQWVPVLKERYAKQGYKVSDDRLNDIAVMAHTRKVFENYNGYSNPSNTPGRGPFSFGNNPNNVGDTSVGSAEYWQKLFGVFVDISASTGGMNLLTNLPMQKSSITVVVAEPIYAGGKKESGEKLPVFQVKLTVTTPLVKGRNYFAELTPGAGVTGATDGLPLSYVGKNYYNGNAIFQILDATLMNADSLAEFFEDGLAITDDAFTTVATVIGDTIDYVNGFTNFIEGFTGNANDASFTAGRNDGKTLANPLSLEEGQDKVPNNYGTRMWNKNFRAGTYHATVNYTVEQVQDSKMDYDFDMLEFGDKILKDAVSQSINNHILSYVFAAGWQHHNNIYNLSGKTLNMHTNTDGTTPADLNYVGLQGVQIPVPAGDPILNSVTGMAENTSSLQRKIVTRLAYSGAMVKNRGRKGRPTDMVTNGTIATVISDLKGYAVSPFDNNLNDDNLDIIGKISGMSVYEDGLMDMADNRVAAFRKASEGDPGLFFCPYILAEKITTIPEGTMSQKSLLKSRYCIAQAGSHPDSQYITWAITDSTNNMLVV